MTPAFSKTEVCGSKEEPTLTKERFRFRNRIRFVVQDQMLYEFENTYKSSYIPTLNQRVA